MMRTGHGPTWGGYPAALAGVAIAVVFVFGLSPSAADGIYQTEDEHGNPMFTDEPPGDAAEAYRLGDINIIQAPAMAERDDSPEPTETDAQPEDPYDGVEIVFPPADEATRRVTGEVEVEVALSPASTELAAGHRVRIDVSGETEISAEAAAIKVRVATLNPGPHNLRATVLDADGRPLVTSEPIRFYLIRQTVGN